MSLSCAPLGAITKPIAADPWRPAKVGDAECGLQPERPVSQQAPQLLPFHGLSMLACHAIFRQMFDELTDEDDDYWCAAQRRQVLGYLSEEGFQAPTVGEWPAWHIAPLISVWAVESAERPDWVGWWVVSGDFPTDYIPCEGERHSRQALRDIGSRWRDAAARWTAGKTAVGWSLRNPDQEKELAPLLAARAELFLEIAEDGSNWEE